MSTGGSNASAPMRTPPCSPHGAKRNAGFPDFAPLHPGKKHMPMVQQKLGAACKKIAVDYGIEGGAPGSKPGFAAAGHLYCDSVEAFRAAFGPHAKEIMADIPNYTDIPPTIQISEVKVG